MEVQRGGELGKRKGGTVVFTYQEDRRACAKFPGAAVSVHGQVADPRSLPAAFCLTGIFLVTSGIFRVTCDPPRAQSVRNRGLSVNLTGSHPFYCASIPKFPTLYPTPIELWEVLQYRLLLRGQ
jgi:hypothetical protein